MAAAPLDDLARQAARGSAEAKAQIERAAAGGDTYAEYLMGMMHISGKGAEQSDSQALDWFLRAARKGRADAQHNAAVIYERTDGSLKDLRRRGAGTGPPREQGFARSQAKLGALLLDGVGGPANLDEGKEWMEKAAAQGEPYGRYRLGLLLSGGPRRRAQRRYRCEADPAGGRGRRPGGALQPRADARDRHRAWRRAMRWRWSGCASPLTQGLPEAQTLLGTIYGTGQYGVKRDDKLAVMWLRRAAVQGHAEAEFSLGLAYAEGRGVKKDPQEAYGWMQRASKHGHAPAIAYVKEIDSYREKKRQARD